MDRLLNYFSGWKTHYISLFGGALTAAEFLSKLDWQHIAATITMWLAFVIMALRSAMKAESKSTAMQLAQEITLMSQKPEIKEDLPLPSPASPAMIDVEKLVQAIRDLATPASKN